MARKPKWNVNTPSFVELRRGLSVRSVWGGKDESKRTKTAIVTQSAAHRDRAPKRKKIVLKRPKPKHLFF